jgi:sugar phosphate isomerase/epimerase
MEPRRFEDSGIEVTIDVHGSTVPAALELIDRAVELAHAAGRQKLIVIHGMGGTDPKSSIRQALRESITNGEYDDIVADSVELAGGGRTDMALRYHGPPLARRLTTNDLR